MADYQLEMTTLEGGDGEVHELRQQAVAPQETEASEDGFRAEENTLAGRPGPSQLVLGVTGAPDGEIETEDGKRVQVRKHGRTATDDGRAHKARQTVRDRGSGSFTLERLRQARQKRALSPLPRIVSVSDALSEAENSTDSTENDAEDERISMASIAQVNVGPSGRPHISLYQVAIYCTIFLIAHISS